MARLRGSQNTAPAAGPIGHAGQGGEERYSYRWYRPYFP